MQFFIWLHILRNVHQVLLWTVGSFFGMKSGGVSHLENDISSKFKVVVHTLEVKFEGKFDKLEFFPACRIVF
jgi:hypothetical protein